jgi:hypothetical protein
MNLNEEFDVGDWIILKNKYKYSDRKAIQIVDMVKRKWGNNKIIDVVGSE